MKKIVWLTGLLLAGIMTAAQDDGRVDLLFAGDIMTHGDQLRSAYYPEDSSWNFKVWFEDIDHLLKAADFTIGNLETPLGVKPFKGYPSFGAPKKLGLDLKQAGFNVLVTANNHAFDRGKAGCISTLDMLDSLQVLCTGTWRSDEERRQTTPLMLEKDGIRIAVLNYSYGSNAWPSPGMMGWINEVRMKEEIETAKGKNPDKVLVFMHWGNEYQSFPSSKQKNLKTKLTDWGADYIIGAHPHVLQPMEWEQDSKDERFVAWSLGNLISNMYFKRTDGGALLHLQLRRENGEVSISKASYILVYVYKYRDESSHIQYRLRAIHEYKGHPECFKDNSYEKMLKYKSLADPVMQHNVNVPAWENETYTEYDKNKTRIPELDFPFMPVKYRLQSGK